MWSQPLPPDTSMSLPVRSFFFSALTLSWLASVTAGLLYVINYSARPGDPGYAAVHWPAATTIAMNGEAMHLVIGAHPRCPCTRASIHELERIMARRPDSIQAHVLLWIPADEEWALAEFWKTTAAIPGVTVHVDVEGIEATRFGLVTSGHTLLYSKEGELLFSGGITASRGHEGSNYGRSAILDLAAGKEARSVRNPVFGCSIFEPPENPDRS